MGEDVRGDDRAIEVLGHVEHVVRDAELLGDAARVVDVGHRTAPRVRRATPELQRGADHVVAGADHQGSGDRRVDTSRHGHEDSHRPSLASPV